MSNRYTRLTVPTSTLITAPVRSALFAGNSALWDWDRRWFKVGETPFVDMTLCVNTPTFGCSIVLPIDSEILVTGKYPDGTELCGDLGASEGRGRGVAGTHWAGGIPRRCPHWHEGTYLGPTSNFGYWEVPCDNFGFLRYGVQIERSILAQRLLKSLQDEQGSYSDAAGALSWANRTVAALKVFWHSTNVSWRPAFISRAVRDRLLAAHTQGTPSVTNATGSGAAQSDNIYLYMPEAYYDRVGSVEGHYKDAFRGNAALDPNRDVFPRNVPPIPWGQSDFAWGSGDRYRRIMNRPSQKDIDVLPQTLERGASLGYTSSAIWNWRQQAMSGGFSGGGDSVLPENYMVTNEIATRQAWATRTYGQGDIVNIPSGLYIGWNHKKEFLADEWEWRERKGNLYVMGFDAYLTYLRNEVTAALSANVLAWVTKSVEVYSDELQTVFPSNSGAATSVDVAEARRNVAAFANQVAQTRAGEVSSIVAASTGAITTVVTLINGAAGVIVGIIAAVINVLTPLIASGVGYTGSAPFVPMLPFQRLTSTTEACPAQDTATFLAQLEGAMNAVQNGGPGGGTDSSGTGTQKTASVAGPVIAVGAALFLLSLLRGK